MGPPKKLHKVAIIEKIHQDGLDLLKNNPNYDLKIIEDTSEQNLIKELPNFEACTLRVSKLPIIDSKNRIGSCVSRPSKFIGIGLNFIDHAKEQNLPIPKEPIIFSKFVNCLSGPNDDIIIPKHSKKTDWEVELGIIIGKKSQYIKEEKSNEHIFGYCVVNDISEREFQIERSGTWDKGKGCDTFGPIGPYLVTKDEIKNVQNLNLELKVNNKIMQKGNTNKMIFNVNFLVSYISNFMTLNPGDIITTGTPPGVGMAMKPQVFLNSGDEMILKIDNLGTQKQKVL